MLDPGLQCMTFLEVNAVTHDTVFSHFESEYCDTEAFTV